MSECRGEYQKLPPGWDCKVDKTTGKCYYINYFTKAMQLEDPRKRYKPLQNSTDSIPMQPLHGSPYHVYPTSTYPVIKAFQGPQPSLHNVSASPLLSIKSQTQMEMSPILRSSSPQTPRMGNLSRRQTIQETSFTNPIDTDAVVAKINNMFPTASEDHIRLLLKKYYNREAVVISALQVEKHPVTMPGPFVTPPAQRHLFHSNSSMLQMTPPTRRFEPMISRTGSPIPGRPNSVASGLYGSPRFSPKPHSSPKMKLRYMKSIFPKADETLLLDILANADNNVQKASEKLIALGYTKRDVMSAPKVSIRAEDAKRSDAGSSSEEKVIPLHPKVLTVEEKESIKKNLQARYKTIAERIILMALESVNYSEDRASQILQIVLQEDESKAKKQTEESQVSKIEGIVTEEPEAINESINESQIADETPQSTSVNYSSSAQAQQPSASNASLEHPSRDKRLESTTTATTLLSSCSVQKHGVVVEQKVKFSIDESLPIPVFDTTYSTPNEANAQAQKFSPISPPQLASSSSLSSSTSPLSSDSSNTQNDELRKTRSKIKSDLIKSTPKTSIGEEITTKNEFQSLLKRIVAKGPNLELCKGPNDGLLLADYVTWNGANPDISLGHKSLAQGSDSSLVNERSNSNARGHNTDLCKGPQTGLAKGSIYSQINRAIATNVKCN